MIEAYWWKGNPINFGDALTPILLERLFGVEARHSPAATADLISTGSILEGVWSSQVNNRHRPIHVVGSGFIKDGNPLPPQLGAQIHSVRGFLSKNRIEMGGEVDDITVGDPGLLVPFAANAITPAPTRHRFGVVLHYLKAGNTAIKRSLEKLLGDVRFIDIRTTDIDSFVSEMKSCEVILSHSLHGLIIADALGIPNAWMDLGGLYGKGFKFLDYFSSTGRAYFTKIEGLPESLKDISDALVEPSANRIAALQDDIRGSFSSALNSLESDESLVPSDQRMLSAITVRSKIQWKSSRVVERRIFEFVSRQDKAFRVNIRENRIGIYRVADDDAVQTGKIDGSGTTWDLISESSRSFAPQQLAIESASLLTEATTTH